MRVLKFGGTSVANAERFLRVADILESNAGQGAGSDRTFRPRENYQPSGGDD